MNYTLIVQLILIFIVMPVALITLKIFSNYIYKKLDTRTKKEKEDDWYESNWFFKYF